jgi:anion-transporting  ArsA/GET3 family ATPase
MKRSHPANIIFVCGKGGVGKTTITAALALSLKMKGAVLCVAVDQPEMLARNLHCNTPGFEPEEAIPGIWTVHLDRQKCLDDFIVNYFRINLLARWILENPVYPYLAAVAPGIREFLILDRIRQFSEASPLVPWITIIVDAPATGHSINLFNTPTPLAAALKLGPLRSRILKSETMWTSPQSSQFVLVTVPEDLPVQESIEFSQYLLDRLGRRVEYLFVNRYDAIRLPRNMNEIMSGLKQFTSGGKMISSDENNIGFDSIRDSIQFLLTRQSVCRHYLQLLRMTLSCPSSVIPRIPERNPEEICETISQRISSRFNA